MDLQTSLRSLSPVPCPSVLEQSLTLNHNRKTIKKGFFWATVNVIILFVILYDISHACPFYIGYFLYTEYFLVVILTLNLLYHVMKILQMGISISEPIPITQEQKKLLGIKDSDPYYKIFQSNSPARSSNSTSINTSSVSYRSNVSPMDSVNYSLSSPSWSYMKCSADLKAQYSDRSTTYIKSSPMKTPLGRNSSVEFITDENSLHKYLKEHEEIEKVNKQSNKSHNSSNLLSSFWSHPVTKTAKDVSLFLKKCQYQLSTQSATKSSSGSPNIKGEDKTASPGQVHAMEVWTQINVDTVALTQWNENLRMWLSQTILERLVNEFNCVNNTLDQHGLSDIKIGSVGLDRLRKTAQMAVVSLYIPSLPTLIPFLEVTANQEYLEKRIRELAKGGCMSEFKWNGGSSYNGKDWDDSLPTDCARLAWEGQTREPKAGAWLLGSLYIMMRFTLQIVMHLLAAYLDTQLMPLPNMPDTKAFSGHHYIKVTDKMPTLKPGCVLMQQVSEKPPHYRVIVGERICEMVKGYNNLFHSILFFIYHVNKIEHGMLGRVNLGRAGINILWVIDQQN